MKNNETPFSSNFSSLDQEILSNFKDFCAEISYSDILGLTRSAMSVFKYNANSNDNLEEVKNKWSDENFKNLNQAQIISLTKDSIRTFYDHFYSNFSNPQAAEDDNDLNFLKNIKTNDQQSSIFADEITNRLKLGFINVNDLNNLMGSLCHYMVAVSNLEKENQKLRLEQFFQDESLNSCIGGNVTRLQELLLDINSDPKNELVLTTLKKFKLQSLDSLKDIIHKGNHIHFLPYIDYALGLKDEDKIRVADPYYLSPQTYIPADQFLNILLSYKDFFTTEAQKYMKERLSELRLIQEKYPDSESIDKNYSDISKRLEVINLNPELLFGETENYAHYWDKNNELKALKHSLGFSALTHEDYQENSLNNFGQETDQILKNIINIWALGEVFTANHPLLFIDKVKELNDLKTQEECDEIKETLPINHQFLINRIQDRFQYYQNSFPKFFEKDKDISTLLFGNASKEDIVQSLENLNEKKQGLPSIDKAKLNDLLNFDDICKNLIFRKDGVEIFQILFDFLKEAKKYDETQIEIERSLLKRCLELSIYSNNSEISKYLLSHKLLDDKKNLTSFGWLNDKAESPLISQVILNNNYEIIQILLKKVTM